MLILVAIGNNEVMLSIGSNQINTASFLPDIEQFYQIESKFLFQQSSIIEYLGKVCFPL
jgi:hypothetical protein